MAWANPNEYIEALQSPQRAFSDPELRDARIVTNRFGLPRPISGNFATVFEVETGRGRQAVRCFMREVTNQQERYAAIAAHLRQRSLPFMVGFEYLPEGIRVRGRWYPILKMDWAEGTRLDTYIEQHLDDPARLRRLGDQWIAVCKALREAQIAHGDLQHGNVLVSDTGDITLIDYDDMIVPGALRLENRELGHRHYQHPSRKTDYGVDGSNFSRIDNFASTVIGVSLLALSLDPSLWAQTKAGDENLLFRDSDYAAPDESPTLRLLTRHDDPHVRAIGQTMIAAVEARSFLDVPPLTRGPLETRATQIKTRLIERLFDLKPAEPPALPAPEAKPDSWVFDHVPPDDAPQTLIATGFSETFLRREQVGIEMDFEQSVWHAARLLVYPYLLITMLRRFSDYPPVAEKRAREAQVRDLEDQVLAAKAQRKMLSRQIVEADGQYQQEIRALEIRIERLSVDLQYARSKEERERAHVERILHGGSDDPAPPAADIEAIGQQVERSGETRRDLERQQHDDQAQLAWVKRHSESLEAIKRLRQELYANENEIALLKRQIAHMRDELARYERITRRNLLWSMVRLLVIDSVQAST